MKLKKTEVLVVKCVNDDLTAHGGFKYPESGMVEAKDWKEDANCGAGLHGNLWMADGYDMFCHGKHFLVIKVNTKDGFSNLGNKVKFRKGEVILSTKDKIEVLTLVKKYAPNDTIYFSDVQTAGDSSTQKAGYSSTQKAGYSSTQTAGDSSTQKAGYSSTQTAGYSSTQTAGYYSTQTAGYYSTQTAGDSSTQKAGYSSTQKAGGSSTQKAGYSSTQKAGYSSTQKAGYSSTQTAGYSSTQTAGYSSTQTAGYYSTQTAGDWSVSISGLNSIVRLATNSTMVVMNYDSSNPKVLTKTNTNKETVTYYVTDCEVESEYTTTPDDIIELKKHEIFVFGSNLNGNHAGGAAKLAQEKFGAKEGIAEGIAGQSYAFPTLGKNMEKLSMDDMKASVEKLYKACHENTRKIFFLTKVGCGIAGFTEEEMKILFSDSPANLVKPIGW